MSTARYAAIHATGSGGGGAPNVNLTGDASAGSSAAAALEVTRGLRYRRPRRETIWIHDLAGRRVGALAAGAGLIDFAIDERLAQSETLYVTIDARSPKADLIVEDGELEWKGRRFYITETNLRREGAELYLDVEAPALWARLGDDKFVGTFTITAQTAAAGLAAILTAQAGGWTPTTDATVAADTELYTLTLTDVTWLELLRQWAKIVGAELAFDTVVLTVDLVTEAGFDRGFAFRYGRNITRLARRRRAPLCTRLYAYGAADLNISGQTPGGEQYVEDLTFYTAAGMTLTEARARFTKRLTWRDTAFVSDVALYNAALERLGELAAGQTFYECNVLDLSELTGIDEAAYTVGDRVTVVDATLIGELATRIVRIYRKPLAPAESIVELSTIDPVVADPTVTDGRDSQLEWELFADLDTSLERRIGSASTILSRLDLTTIAGAEWVTGFSLNGVGVGTGSVSITAFDSTSGALLHPITTLDVTDGDPVAFTFTQAEKDLAVAARSLTVRAQSSGSSVGITTTARGLAFWVLARGTTQQERTVPNSQRFDYTGAVQQFTVPDDVTEVTIECVAAAGGINDLYGAYRANGGSVTATFPVSAGAVLDVRVGECPLNDTAVGGWPNGGNGDEDGAGGGGRSEVRPNGSAITAALIVAGAGGGSGDQFATASQAGGPGGFYVGADAVLGTPVGGLFPGGGATQTAGGTPTAAPFPGSAGAQGQGGNAGNVSNAFTFGPGGGGDGWFGGAGGGGNNASGSGNGGGGGGGSGYVGPTGYDIDYTDATNDTDGYVLITWRTPEE